MTTSQTMIVKENYGSALADETPTSNCILLLQYVFSFLSFIVATKPGKNGWPVDSLELNKLVMKTVDDDII